MKKLSIIAMLAASLSFTTTSCEDWLDVNNNIDAPDYVEGYLYLSGITQSWGSLYWDIRATGPLTQMMGTSSYSNFANNYYSQGSDAGGEVFRMVYWLHGMNLENMINQSVEAGQWTLAGIGTAIKAFDWDVLTKYHGELPYDEAYTPGKLSFSYDSQEHIMGEARNLAYKAIEYLEMEDNTDYGNKISGNDWVYYGDKAKWIKFCYAVIVRNLAALTNKSDFVSKYADELLTAASKSFASSDDDATLKVTGGGASTPSYDYNNFWSPYNENLMNSYWQHDYAVQVLTGTVPQYDEATGNKKIHSYPEGAKNEYYPYELAEKQIVTDTIKSVPGHYDPRMALKLATEDNEDFQDIDNADSVKAYKYYGSSFTGSAGPIGTAPSFYGKTSSDDISTTDKGRWLYREDADYIVTTYAQIQFCVAETYWKKGDKPNALAAFKKAVAADMETTGRYISEGKEGDNMGDKISKALYNELAADYVAGPYVEGMTEADLTLSHIMMQKYACQFPWGANEAWVDLRKYHYDVQYTGDYPKTGNGWDKNMVDQKWDSDDTKVFKGFYLAPAQVQGRKGTYNEENEGSPCYRVRGRYNSEYMWNKPALSELKPISGMANNYHTSIPWFAYPGDVPESL
ncbi:MAG: SusD/RagB family nutrient-binding outer membrane lipoprotein [Bacteroides sp.]|nr:SusD/RagB family nutrient-binding outer membrane lipoprotein [Bacteroides sp.]